MRQRAGWRWMWNIGGAALLAVAPATAEAATIFVGLGGGGTQGFVGGAGGWARAAAADLPDVGYDAAPALADLDGDGDRDALVGERAGRVLAYQNTGSNAVPAWLRQPSWDPPFDVGYGAAPAMADLDGDRDFDLLIGSTQGDVRGMENTGTGAGPVWHDRPAWSVAGLGANSHPALGDVTGDGRVDLLVGLDSGAVLAFAGTGVPEVPFARRPDLDPPVVGQRIAPAIGDLDGDGAHDLVLGDGNAVLRAFRNVGGVWTAQPAWAPPDPGTGPASPALVPTAAPPPPPPPSSGPLARVTASPTSGLPPLRVRLDASQSSDPQGDPLAFAWDFGDGNAGPTTQDAAVARLAAAATAYDTAKATRDAGRYTEAVYLYLADVQSLLTLTGWALPGPLTVHGTNRIDRGARWYLQKIAHDLGGVYLFHSLGLAACAQYGTSLQYSRESVAQALAGGFPQLPELGGTNANIASATSRLQQAGCAIPPPAAMFGPAAGPTTEHTYMRAGTYVARVTVTDGPTRATASATITVGSVPPPPPPPGGNGPEGFGAGTRGGAGGREIRVTQATDAAVRAAFKAVGTGNAVIVFDVQQPIEVLNPLPRLTGANITVEGNGATLVGTRLARTAPMIDLRAHDVILRNLRLRNGGDNLSIYGANAYNVLVSRVSSTGAGDDGISIAYGAHDVTVEWSLLAGNTRSLFLKYGGTTNVSLHHLLVAKQWARGPLVAGSTLADVRNLVVEDWTSWGARFEDAARGNVVGCAFLLSPYAASLGGKTNGALRLISSGQVFTAGNVYRGVAQLGAVGTAPAPLPAPAVTTLPMAEMEAEVRAEAGVMPRDAVDQTYLETAPGWRTGKYTPYRVAP